MKLSMIGAALAVQFAQVVRAGDLLEVTYANEEDIPSGFESLYSEKDGKFVLTGVRGIKTQDDVNRQLEANRKIRDELKTAKAALAKFGDMDADEVLEKLNRIEELEAAVAAGGKPDESKLEALIEAKVKARLAPVEREKARLERELGEKDKMVNEYTTRERQRTISDQLRAVATKANVRQTALEDILLIGQHVFEINEDGVAQTKDGLPVDVWLTEQQNVRPHWWPESAGTGANGGGGFAGGKNPFSAEHWNMTEQGKIYAQNPAKAEQLAKAAGTKVGGSRPVK